MGRGCFRFVSLSVYMKETLSHHTSLLLTSTLVGDDWQILNTVRRSSRIVGHGNSELPTRAALNELLHHAIRLWMVWCRPYLISDT